MFKLLPLLLICLVADSLALAEPDDRYKLISSSSSRGSIRSSLSNSYQSENLSAKSQQRTQPLQTNSVTSFEDEDNSSHNNNDDLDDQELNAPASTFATATQTPTTTALANVPAAVTRLTAADFRDTATATASASTPSLRLSSSFHLPASSSSSTTIQHHFLPPETIPLPITISTRPGLRTVIAPETITVHEPTLVKVGEFVQKIPTAVSHQSQTVVHKHARIITPIVAPAVRTYTSQVLRAYHTPLIFAPQTALVRSSTRAGTNYASGTGSSVNAEASAKGGATGASASASIISNANHSAENNNTNNNKKYKY